MKVRLQDDYRKLYTLEDMDRAMAVIEAEKDDLLKPADWLKMAVNEALKETGFNQCERVIEASAHTAGNRRVWNAYTDNSGNMDVWITGTAKTLDGYIEIGAYLSDIWQTGGTDYRQHIFSVRYARV